VTNKTEVNQQNGFYKLQARLREEGWYVEWMAADQPGHFWEDIGVYHEEGPYEGIEIDLDKCLFNVHEDSYYINLDGLPDELSPETIKSDNFYISPELKGAENLEAVLPIFDECGCSYEITGDEVYISWE
jgi:hypothetical protein